MKIGRIFLGQASREVWYEQHPSSFINHIMLRSGQGLCISQHAMRRPSKELAPDAVMAACYDGMLLLPIG
jgi:hypothetical protein